ncbi:MAG: helix-turn-helix transcriptional regulator [Spirochaetes bacterium]|jgi:transcriptional regulator with XRE-family HTH domain|nr:helix-turn-helix transcriptional regulator [Spirochaetota bacterium]
MYGQRLRDIRKSKNLKLKDIAEKLSTSDVNVSRWEKSKYPPLEAIEKCCNIYEVSLSDFFATGKDGIPLEYRHLIEALQLLPDEIQIDVLKHCSDMIATYLKAAGKM